jgi:hypothetical protein
MADVVLAGFADVGGHTGMLGLTDPPAAIGRLTNVVRARGSVHLKPNACHNGPPVSVFLAYPTIAAALRTTSTRSESQLIAASSSDR